MFKWCLFRYESGANPYIAKTKKEKEKIIKKYKNNVVKIDNTNYFINDIEDGIFWSFI